jgi:uncharacterized protein (TIGR02597 family)
MAFGETAYTTPVGYITVDVPAETDTLMGVPLQTASAWAGASTGISADTVSVAASSYVAGAYANTHMLQVTTGTLAGRVFPILSNLTGSVTVDPVGSDDLQTQGFASGNKFVIRPYWTLDTLFPAGAGVGQSSNPESPSSSVFFADNVATGTNRSLLENFFYYDGSIGGDAGWYDVNDLGGGVQGGKLVPPDRVLTVRNLNPTALEVVLTGEVPSVPVASLVISDVVDNDSALQVPFPIDTSLDDSNLFESGAFADSPNPEAPTDVLFVYDPLTTGTNPSTSATYFHYDGSVGGDPGWYNANDLGGGVVGSQLLLKAGSQILIRKPSGVAFEANTWTAPLPYTP